MAEKRRFLDVWIVESNTVYQEVPYDVVADWLQQGRLLDDDKVKPSGTKEWGRLGDSPEFRPYSLVAVEPTPQDAAAALEPSEADVFVEHRRHHEEEDDDVDMIPLIDVTLVLLIFFMLTATTAGAAALIPTPKAETGAVVDDPNGVRIDIKPDVVDGKLVPDKPLYSVAEGNKPPEMGNGDLDSLQSVLDRLKGLLDRRTTPAQLTINAHKELRAVYARDLLLGLRAEPFRSKLASNFFGTSEVDR